MALFENGQVQVSVGPTSGSVSPTQYQSGDPLLNAYCAIFPSASACQGRTDGGGIIIAPKAAGTPWYETTPGLVGIVLGVLGLGYVAYKMTK